MQAPMADRSIVLTKVSRALQSVLEDRAVDIRPEHHLVEDLGFDSAGIASLTIALEDEFDELLLLNDWIASASSPSELTVDSLVEYLLGVLPDAT
jgi:acyl carrier protein